MLACVIYIFLCDINPAEQNHIIEMSMGYQMLGNRLQLRLIEPLNTVHLHLSGVDIVINEFVCGDKADLVT